MTTARKLVAAAAAELVGTPFRLQGRDPRRGLDCVGVLLVALSAAGHHPRIPAEYSLRRTTIDNFSSGAAEIGLLPVEDNLAAGDVVVVRPGTAQFHAAVVVGPTRLVHAHAGLGRVVASPAPLPWPIEHHWRLA